MERVFPLPFAPAAPTEGAASPAGLPERIRAAAGGSQEAFRQLYDGYVRMVHAVVLARVPGSDVDDLVQDVFLTAFDRLNTLRDPNTFGGWLAAIARNRATDYLRRARKEVALPRDLPGGTRIEPDAIAALEAIRALPECYRETLMMRLVEGMNGPEIAERTGLTPASVRVNLHRGMKELRKRLGWNGRE